MKKKIGIGIVAILLLASSMLVVEAGKPGDDPQPRGAVAQVAIYTGAGTWDDGIVAFENFLDWKGITWGEVGYKDINNGALSGYDVVYFPGGDAYQYKKWVDEPYVQTFVNNGGGYLGICAGAYFACDRIDWEGDTYEYYLDLYMGIGYGAIDPIVPWADYDMSWYTMNLANPLCQWEPSQQYGMYYGGPAFYPDAGQSQDVICTYDEYYNDAAAINFEYGSGHVALFGPHFEIEEDDTRDGTTFGDEFDDLGTDWTILWTTMDYLLGNPISQPPGTEPPDTEAPVINWVTDSPDPQTAGQDVTITAYVTDNEAVDEVYAVCNGNNYPMAFDGNNYICTITTGQAGGETELFFDGFESGFDWYVWGPGKPWQASSDDPYEGASSAYVKKTGAGNPTYMEKTIDTSGCTGLTLSYYRQLKGFDVADDFSCEYYDGSWHTLEYVNSENGGYEYREYTLPSSCENNPNFKIRFMAECGAVTEKAYVDNVLVTYQGTGANWDTGLYPYTVYADDPSGNEATPVGGDFTLI